MVGYKFLLIIPIALFIFSIAVLANSYTQTGEWFQRSIELKGGTQITLDAPGEVDLQGITDAVSSRWPAKVKLLRSFAAQKLQVETGAEVPAEDVLSELESLGLDTSDPSIQQFGPSIGEGFWYQAQLGIILAFIFMGIIVFFIFRTLVPSGAVMLCAISDIIITLGVMSLTGLELSLAGLAAILMLIGYSVDTDILLTTRLTRGSGRLKERVRDALYTGLTMTGTTLGALVVLLVLDINPVLSQIATILVIGLAIDLVNTWLQNSVLLRWHCERREGK